MPTYNLTSDACLFHADCRDALAALPDNSLDSCVTDPPYALVSIVKRFGSPNAAPAKGNDAYMRASAGFMGKAWDTGETAFTAEFWAQVLRVLKPGAHLAAFGASRGYHRMACAIEDAGFEVRDSLMWIYGTGFPKSHDVSKGIDRAAGAEREVVGRRPDWVASDKWREAEGRADRLPDSSLDITAPATPAAREWEGWGTALKPAFEPIVLARKPLSEGTVAANVLRWRTGALNIGACRVGTEERAARAGGMQRKANPVYGEFAGVAEVSGTTSEGRWPANVVTDGSAEVVEAFPNAGGGYGKRGAGGQNGIYSPIGGTMQTVGYGDSGSAARFYYSAKASKADRAGSKHPTVKPIDLIAYLQRMVTPPGGVTLDPFAGSGTAGVAAAREGFRCVLIEREAEYVEDIRRRFQSPPLQNIEPHSAD